MVKITAILVLFFVPLTVNAIASSFVTVKGHRLYIGRTPYYFVGANYWYGPLLGLEKDRARGVDRLRKELDFLKKNGITNLRLISGAEGTGLMNGIRRVGPPLQPEQGRFDEHVFEGLDRVLYEMGKRGMRAVIFLSNNWEWSGGFQQYLIWNGAIGKEYLTKKPNWDELRDVVAKFYSCTACRAGYDAQVNAILSRRNRYNGKKYVDDPAIVAWELANEPRPMRTFANDAYKRWISETAAMIKSRDKNHLVTIGHEGWIGTQDIALYEAVHADKNVDYLTIHIWPKNWGWFTSGQMAAMFPNVIEQTIKYINENVRVAEKLDKPLVIEEFGLPRDGESFDPGTPTTYRDRYYQKVLSFIGNQTGGNSYIAGADFWAFGGTARPKKGQVYWKDGDPYMGDPPMEEQGLNSIFDSDRSTWDVINIASRKISRQSVK
jgi:mannan endo-1,4-beta-mannosidase